MTSPSSYVFYYSSNPSKERKNGTNLIRVTIYDGKIKTLFNHLVENLRGVLTEETLSQTVFSLHENKHGEKYVKQCIKITDGKNTDTSLISFRDGVLFEPFVTSREYYLLVEKTILGWFGSTYAGKSLEVVKGQLLFPALRMMTYPPSINVLRMLADMQNDYGIVLKALRENSSWLAFLMDVCSPTAEKLEDVENVHAYPEELLPLAIMELGVSMSSLFSRDKETLMKVRASFTNLDMQFIHFMFRYLPAAERPQALETLLSLVFAHSSRKNLRNSVFEFRYVNNDISLNKVPLKLRPKLAQEFLKSLKETNEKMSEVRVVQTVQVLTKLTKVFQYWFSQFVLEPSVKTQLTVDDLETRFRELFGIPLIHNPSHLKFVSKKDTIFCILPHLTGKDAEKYHPNVFLSLKALIKKLPKDKGMGVGYSAVNGYIADDGYFLLSYGEFYSLDDILQMIESGSKAVDEWLTKLGRDITPVNRLAFLTLGSEEREFKESWQLYDWGVTDSIRITALQLGEVSDKDDVLTYNALPDEMFYELLALQSGEELSPFIFSESWEL